MTQIPLSLGAHQRSLSPEAVLVNAYVESAPTQQATATAIRARPGLGSFTTAGVSANRGMVSKPGLFGDAALLVQGTSVYTLTAAGVATQITGTLAGQNAVDIDAGQDADLNSVGRVATGSALYKITTDAVTEEDFPTDGGAGASSVCYHRGFWLASEAGTDLVYYQVPGDDNWTALSFASAEFAPDPVVAIRTLGEQLWLLGAVSYEAWALTGEASPALAPYGGLVGNVGCRARAAAASLPGAVLWVDNVSQVRLTVGGVPEVISDPGLTEQIRSTSASDLRASWFAVDGHTFYVLTLGTNATWVYDLTSRKWAKWSSGTFDFLRVGQFAVLGERAICADLLSSAVYAVDPDRRDDAGVEFPVEFMAFLDLAEGQASCANVRLKCEVGDAPRTGQGSDPKIQMRYSGDEGKSWSGWRERSLGITGASLTEVRWNGLGQIRAPFGRIFHFRVSDPVGRRFSDVRMNA